MAQMIARYKPGVNVAGFATTAVLAGRFVKISATITASGDYSIAPCGAGERAFGVAEADSAATSEAASSVERRVNVVRSGAIARVTAGDAISAGGLVAAGTGGKAIPYVAPTLTGNSEALPGAPVILGQALNTVAADGDIVDVALF